MKARVRTLRATDLLSLALFNSLDGHDRARTRDRLAQPASLLPALCRALGSGLASHRSRHLCIGLERQRVWGVVSVRMRSGPRAWEIDHLYLDPRAQESSMDLLEMASVAAGKRGAQRLFLRLSAQNPLEEQARLCGFFPCLTETLYQREPGRPLPGVEAPLTLRPRQAEDAFALFRLYNANTPQGLRSAYGLTLEQWRDAQEPPVGMVRELVYESDYGVRGWLSLCLQRRQGHLELAAHPDERDLVQRLVQAAIATLGPSRSHLCLVPEYATGLQAALEQRGFRPQGEFRLLIKAIAKEVKEPGLAPAVNA